MVTSCYTGIELAFFSVVYGTAIGNTSNLVDSDTSPKRFIGLSGILIGVGEIIGGLSFGILGGKTNRLGRDPIVILGYFTHMIAFFLVFINFPKDSPLQQTSEAAYISSSLAIALVCSFLLGFADSCYNTQMYSIIGTVYSENSANAFALFKFFQVGLVQPLTLFWHSPFLIGAFPFQSIACACALFYSAVANLYVQLCILAVSASIGTVTFVLVEWQAKREAASDLRVHQN